MPPFLLALVLTSAMPDALVLFAPDSLNDPVNEPLTFAPVTGSPASSTTRI